MLAWQRHIIYITIVGIKWYFSEKQSLKQLLHARARHNRTPPSLFNTLRLQTHPGFPQAKRKMLRSNDSSEFQSAAAL